jgi:Predicted permeases
MILMIGLLVLLYLTFQILHAFAPAIKTEMSQLLRLKTVFLSILFEAFPFILIGIFVSSIIQEVIPAQFLDRIFSKNKALGFMAALLFGAVFPVCDCATVPVAARLMKKGVPVPVAVTFLLSAPIVNPIVILSTFYAFPGYPFIAAFRVITGLLVALVTGLLFTLLPAYKTDGYLKHLEAKGHDHRHEQREHEENGRLSVFEAVLTHAAEEFFEVGGYLIAGAALSSVIQVCVPKDVMTGLGANGILSLLLMMLAAFVLSICSTSDAFIARSFAGNIPIASVMGFMVLGPMLDLKNLFMLFGNFKKGFVFRLVAAILITSFIILATVTKLLFRWWA